MNWKSFLAAALLSAGLILPSFGIRIVLDYRYDTAGFFEQPGAKTALRDVADLFESLIQDQLLRIDSADFPGTTWTATIRHPGTNQTIEIVNPVIPENTVIIFPAGLSLSGGTTGRGGNSGFRARPRDQFFERIVGRGQTGATAPDPADRTDYAISLGSISFDNSDRTWNFTRANAPGTEFYSTAIHEFCHVFGFGIASTFRNLIVDGEFTGANSVQAFGGRVPLHGDEAHWQNNSNNPNPRVCFDPNNPNNVLSSKLGVFGQIHGADQIAIMDPSRCDDGQNFPTLTALDIAALQDIGWEVAPPLAFRSDLADLSQPSFRWNTLPTFRYTLLRGQQLDNLQPLSIQPGNGAPASFTDRSPLSRQAFYRLQAEARTSVTDRASALRSSQIKQTGIATFTTLPSSMVSQAPSSVTCACDDPAHNFHWK